jgi:hypothetical protein
LYVSEKKNFSYETIIKGFSVFAKIDEKTVDSTLTIAPVAIIALTLSSPMASEL